MSRNNDGVPMFAIIMAAVILVTCAIGAIFPSSKYASQSEVDYVNKLQQENYAAEAESNRAREQEQLRQELNKIQAGYYNR